MGKGSEIYSIQICIRTKNVKYFCHEPSDGNPNLTSLSDRKKPTEAEPGISIRFRSFSQGFV